MRKIKTHRPRGQNESVLTRDRCGSLLQQGSGISSRFSGHEEPGSERKSFGTDRKWFGVIENDLEAPEQGRGYEVMWFGSARKWFGTDGDGGGGPRASRLELPEEGRGIEVEWFGSDREWLWTGRESFGTEVKGFGSGRKVGEDRGWVVWKWRGAAWKCPGLLK